MDSLQTQRAYDIISPMEGLYQGDSIFWVEVDRIKPNPFQPRKIFDESTLLFAGRIHSPIWRFTASYCYARGNRDRVREFMLNMN